jgi:hypothetical protein
MNACRVSRASTELVRAVRMASERVILSCPYAASPVRSIVIMVSLFIIYDKGVHAVSMNRSAEGVPEL